MEQGQETATGAQQANARAGQGRSDWSEDRIDELAMLIESVFRIRGATRELATELYRPV